MTLAAFLTVAFMHLMVAISPGPAVLMSARIGLTEGSRAGFFVAAGIGIGGVVWASAALFGLNLVFQAAPALLWGLRLSGAAYLLWLAWGLWRGADQPIVAGEALPPRGALAAFRLGLWTQLSNPKPAVLLSARWHSVRK